MVTQIIQTTIVCAAFLAALTGLCLRSKITNHTSQLSRCIQVTLRLPGTNEPVALIRSAVFPSARQFDGSKMAPDYRVPPIVMYERKDSKWILKDKHT